jgi:IMP cyclohydrolase
MGYKRKYPDIAPEILKLMDENGISKQLYNYRTRYAKKKMTPYEAATTPNRGQGYKNKYGDALKIARSNGITAAAFYSRVKHLKWSIERAMTEKTDQEEILTEEEKQIAVSNGITVHQAKGRVRRGMPVKKAITKKMQTRKHRTESIKIALENGIQRGTFNNRIAGGWNEYKARTYPVGSLECLTLKQNKLMIERGLSHMAVHGRIKAGMSPDEAISSRYIVLDKEKPKPKIDTSLKRLRARINGAPTVHMVEVKGNKKTVFCGYAMASDKVEVIDDKPAAIDNISCKWCKKYFEYGGR